MNAMKSILVGMLCLTAGMAGAADGNESPVPGLKQYRLTSLGGAYMTPDNWQSKWDKKAPVVVPGALMAKSGNANGTTWKGTSYPFDNQSGYWYEGYILLEAGKTYSAASFFDDGGCVYIDGQLVYNQGTSSGYNATKPSITPQPFVCTKQGWHFLQVGIWDWGGGRGCYGGTIAGVQWSDADPSEAVKDYGTKYWKEFWDADADGNPAGAYLYTADPAEGPNMLSVAFAWDEEAGWVSGGLELTELTPGVPKTLSASGEIHMHPKGHSRTTCIGWKVVTTAADGMKTQRSGGADELTFNVMLNDGEHARVEWLWKTEYLVTATAGSGGTVSPTEQWVEEGGMSEPITAKVEADFMSFYRWSGDSESRENPLVIPSVTAPMSFTALFGRSICVSTNGSDEAAGTEQAPYRTPEKAIESATEGSTVTIGEGTYKLTKELFVTNAVRVVGAGRDKTILDAQSKRRVMTINSTFAHVSGVTLRNGAASDSNAYGGGAKIIGSGGVLEDCTVTGCSDSKYDPAGGGIYMSSSKGVISRCIIRGNSLPRIYYSKGGGVWMNAGRMDNSLIVGNTSNEGGAGTGAAIFADGSAVIRNCTIVDNETTKAKCGGLYANNSNVRVINCVLWGNRAPKDTSTGAPDWWEASTANFDHCVAPTKPSGEGCKNDDPSFKGASSGDYTVYSSSSLRNAGKDLADIGELDLNGNPRVSGDSIDIGCYEFDDNQKEVSFGVVPLKTLVGGTVAFSNTSVGFTDEATHAFTLIDEHGAETAVPSADEAGFTSAEPGLYSVRLVVTDGGKSQELTLPKYLLVAPLTNYVDVAATAPRSPYGTPETAATNVLNVIPYAMDGSTVFVKDGLYKLWKEVRLDDAITMVSENGAERTILKRTTSGGYRPLRINHSQAVARGFTVTGGYSTDAGGGGVLIDVHGGTLEDSIVTNNENQVYDSNGGGVYLGGGGKVRRCLIGWNRANRIHNNYGGGVRMVSGLLEDCLIISNRTYSSDERPESGGGVYADGGTVRNCTIIGNKSYSSAGGLYQGSGATVYNCVIRDNYLKLEGKSETTKNFGFGDSKKVWNCALPVAGGLNSVTNEPAFKDAAALDFHPAQGSPLINAGTNVNYTAESVDLEGNPRIFNFGRKSSRPDIGCYETPWGTPGFLLLLK